MLCWYGPMEVWPAGAMPVHKRLGRPAAAPWAPLLLWASLTIFRFLWQCVQADRSGMPGRPCARALPSNTLPS